MISTEQIRFDRKRRVQNRRSASERALLCPEETLLMGTGIGFTFGIGFTHMSDFGIGADTVIY